MSSFSSLEEMKVFIRGCFIVATETLNNRFIDDNEVVLLALDIVKARRDGGLSEEVIKEIIEEGKKYLPHEL